MKLHYWFIGALLVFLHFSNRAFSQTTPITPERWWKIDQAFGHKEIGSLIQVDSNYTYKFVSSGDFYTDIRDSLGQDSVFSENFLDSASFTATADSTINELRLYKGATIFGPYAVKIKEVTTFIEQKGDTLFYTNELGQTAFYLPDLDSFATYAYVDSLITLVNNRIDTFYTPVQVDSLLLGKADTNTINQIIANIDSCCSANGIDTMYIDPDYGSPGESVIIIQYFDGSQDIFNINEVYESGKITSINFVNDSTVQFVQNSGNNSTAISWNINGFEGVINKYAHSNSYGECYIISDDPDTITFLSGSTNPLQVTEMTSGLLQGFSHSSGTLTYTGIDTITVMIQYSMSFNFAEGTDMYVWIYHDGTAIDKSEFKRTIQNPNDEDNAGVSILFELAPNDTISIYMAPGSHTGDDNLIIDDANLNIIRAD